MPRDVGLVSVSGDKPSRKKQNQQKHKPANYKRHGLASIERDDVAALVKKVAMHSPSAVCQRFDALPLSSLTLKGNLYFLSLTTGLAACSFVEMTDIQRKTLSHSLTGRDILGAARTGSGKTLAFILPVLEKLFTRTQHLLYTYIKENWSALDGLGALIISPTRELALQTFQTLKQVGKFHGLSAGLLIGGKDLVDEQDRIARMNILVTTPGRFLQHMDQSSTLNCDTLQILVLDEADRVLDGGFQKCIDAILTGLPRSRQTLLFSATQTKSVKDLARVSMNKPEYVGVHDANSEATPENLTQRFVICELKNKMDILFSFLKSHLKCKVIVFLSSCKQVRFVHDSFCKMQPGTFFAVIIILKKQSKRMTIFDAFCEKKEMCLFATDIAARGLDFPKVDWVVQVDCPEDGDTYIHRVGRTARNTSPGNALLFLLESEKAMLDVLKAKKIPITEIKINPDKIKISVSQQMQSLCFQSPEMKYLGQKAFTSYMRSCFLQKNKDVFDVTKMDGKAFAESLGLPGTPKLNFVEKRVKNELVFAANLSESDKEEDKNDVITKMDKMFKRKNVGVLSQHYKAMLDEEKDDSETDLFMTIKRKDHGIEGDDHVPNPIPVTKKEILKAKERAFKERGRGVKMAFDEAGNAVSEYQMETLDAFSTRMAGEMSSSGEEEEIVRESTIGKLGKKHTKIQAENMQRVDIDDKAVEKERLRERKRVRKAKEKEAQVDYESGSEDDEMPGEDYESGSDDVMCGPGYVSGASESDDDVIDIDLGESGDESWSDVDDEDEEDQAPLVSKKRSMQAETLEVDAQKHKKKKMISSLGELEHQTLEDIAMSLMK